MADSPHDLPSARHLASFHAFYETARFNKNGTATLTLVIPAEMKRHLLKLSDNDGMALNVSIWETALPGEDGGDVALARALGMD